ncbi:MAG: FAD-dependent oxidoreductase [Lachnospiraceae bacterium]|nr:FAD-dependent oxidoreductase [Lachnospiraceae bacterium]
MHFTVDAKPLGAYDVIVAGGGLAGTFAAVSAAREGGKVLLLESEGCLGGTLTSGIVPSIMDEQGKGGMLGGLFAFLNAHGMSVSRFGPKTGADGKKIPGRIVDPEGCKYYLDRLAAESGVQVLFYSRVSGVALESGGPKPRIGHVLVSTEAGNYEAEAKVFIDATGNGNLAALSGCGFECGEPGTGRMSPASTEYAVVGLPEDYDGTDSGAEKRAYSDMLKAHGIRISAEEAGIVKLPALKEWDVSSDYQYGVRPDDIFSLSEAAVKSRAEVFETVEAHKAIPGYEKIWLSHTAPHLGLREGRRVFGEYRIREEDMIEGRRFPDGICLVRSRVDLHKIHPTDTLNASRGIRTKPYEIPYRALIARDVSNLLLAGRCLSGDFYPHASYRMMGNMSATGEAAGFAAMWAVRNRVPLTEVPAESLRERMKDYLGENAAPASGSEAK